MSEDQLLPARSIRRFDVFAEFNRQERLEKGDPADVAKGYGIWVAKVVASRRGRSKSETQGSSAHRTFPESRFRSLDDEEQTDKVFDAEIVDRMGEMFYNEVFSPAIELARKQGKKYEDIRDAIREDWQLPRSRR